MSDIEKLGLTEKQLKYLRSIWLPPPQEIEEQNALMNCRMLKSRFDDFDVRLVSGLKRYGDAVIVMSSGSSLNAVLKDVAYWKGDIICSTSHAVSVVHHAAIPDFITCVDARGGDGELNAPASVFADSIYVSHPCTNPSLFENMERLGLFLHWEENSEFYNRFLPALFPWIFDRVITFVDSGAFNLYLATILGYSRVYLAGYDIGGQRFTESKWTGKDWEKIEPPESDMTNPLVTGQRKNCLLACLAVIRYGIKKKNTRFYQLSERTVLDQIPISRDFDAEIDGRYPAHLILKELNKALEVLK